VKTRENRSSELSDWSNATTIVETAILYTVFQKSDAKIQITITTAYLIKISYPRSSFNYRIFGTNVANVYKIHCTVAEQQIFLKMELKNRIFQCEKY